MTHVTVCCCCRTHVDRVVTAIAVVAFILGLIEIFGFFSGIGASAIVSCVITTVCAGCLWYGVSNALPNYYWPFMIWNFLRILGGAAVIVILSLAIVGFASDEPIEDFSGHIMTRAEKDDAKIKCSVAIVIYSISLLLTIWFQYVVVKGYRSLKGRSL